MNPFQQDDLSDEQDNSLSNNSDDLHKNHSNQSSDKSMLSSSFLDRDMTTVIEFDKEIFFHHKNITKNTSNIDQSFLSSAF